MARSFKVKLTKSLIGCTQTQIATVKAIGLKKRSSEVVLADNAANRGQIFKVQHLLTVTPLK